MKKLFKMIFIVTFATVLLCTVLAVVLFASAANSKAGSVGIIGGADGPTAVLISSALLTSPVILFMACFVVFLLVFFVIRRLMVKRK